jgi:hypothetical protein
MRRQSGSAQLGTSAVPLPLSGNAPGTHELNLAFCRELVN